MSCSSGGRFKTTAWHLLEEEVNDTSVKTGCEQIDELFGLFGLPGLSRGVITEFCGFWDSGKTQICLQLCYNAITAGGRALFIDSKGGFDIYRFIEMAEIRMKRENIKMTLEQVLENLLVVEALSLEDWLSHIEDLEETLLIHDNVRLVVFDQFSFLINLIDVADRKKLYKRTLLVKKIMRKLIRVAHNFNVAVVLTNEFTSVIKEKAYFVPLLGESFFERVTQRAYLSRASDSERFFINLEKSLHHPSRTIEFKLTEAGVE